MLHVNLEAPIRATRALLPGMLERGSGPLRLRLLAGRQGAVAAGLDVQRLQVRAARLPLALRQDLRGSGVGASLVLPGFIRDAGMFADSGMKPPAGMGTGTPEQVGEAVAKAIETDRAEFVVAPPQARAVSAFGSSFPGLAAVVQRGTGERVAEELASKQTDKR